MMEKLFKIVRLNWRVHEVNFMSLWVVCKLGKILQFACYYMILYDRMSLQIYGLKCPKSIIRFNMEVSEINIHNDTIWVQGDSS